MPRISSGAIASALEMAARALRVASTPPGAPGSQRELSFRKCIATPEFGWRGRGRGEGREGTTLRPGPFVGGGGDEEGLWGGTQDEDERWEEGMVVSFIPPAPWDALFCGFLFAIADGVRGVGGVAS